MQKISIAPGVNIEVTHVLKFIGKDKHIEAEVGKNGATQILYTEDLDLVTWYVDIYGESGSSQRIFKPDVVTFKK